MACCGAESAKRLRWTICTCVLFVKTDATEVWMNFGMNFCQGYFDGYVIGLEHKVVFKSNLCCFLRVEKIFAGASCGEDLKVIFEGEGEIVSKDRCKCFLSS